ncbi:hypothetical protein BH09VER1_BH09VER1_47180 [soil metagenome]
MQIKPPPIEAWKGVFFQRIPGDIGVKRRWVGGFSLVEVILAVGLIAFVLTAILGLVTLAVQGTKKADMDARLAVLAGRMSAGYQGRSFAAALAELSTNAVTYYDYYGIPTNAAGAYFACTAANVTPTGSSTNLAIVRFQFRWPSPQWSSTNSYVSSISNFQ